MKIDFHDIFLAICLVIIGCFYVSASTVNPITFVPIAQSIYENRKEGESCKELNMNMYIWLRSQGYHPDVQIGTKNGYGHLWLELSGRIIDVTDPTYYGKKAEEVKDVYKLNERLQ